MQCTGSTGSWKIVIECIGEAGYSMGETLEKYPLLSNFGVGLKF